MLQAADSNSEASEVEELDQEEAKTMGQIS
jgi:hypothetical protein